MTGMPWRNPETWGDLARSILAIATLLSGGIGGALIAGRHIIDGRTSSFIVVIAYLLVGAGIGFGTFAMSPIIPGLNIDSFSDAALYGFMAGMFGTLGLAASSVVLRFSAKIFGIDDIQVKVVFHEDKKDESEKKGD